MKKKILLNVFYSLGIILSMFGFVWSFKGANYPLVILFILGAIFFIYLKIQLLREVNKTFKK